jgi:enoyl-CoA hydratase/carnithine racemase
MTGTEAAALGLAYRAYDPAGFEDEVERVVTTMAGRRPDALATTKRLVHDGLALSLDDGIALEQRAVLAHISGEAGGAGVSTFAGRGAAE